MTVFIDPHRFRRAVINVYENAMQATSAASLSARPDGGACVRIGTRGTAGRFEISVSDSGPGIAPETLATIFEPLYSTKSFDVGLGLPTVNQIME
ncbi:MAG: HAMP domain-containing histidine kinase, partial [SAR324 cluster bacterium]|nr:HAMP domain-containing histidine kinase [SAR324 cluster bacterium]